MKCRIPFLLSILFLLINTASAAIQEKAPINTHPDNWKNSEIATLLKKGKVVTMRSMRDYLYSHGKKAEFDGNVFFVELDNGLKAVFKSVSHDDLGDAYAEGAAYQASVTLGFPNIPQTVMTELDGMKGSLKLFV